MGAEVVLLGVWVEGGQGACFPGDDREGANIFLPFFLGLGLFHGLNIKVKECFFFPLTALNLASILSRFHIL